MTHPAVRYLKLRHGRNATLRRGTVLVDAAASLPEHDRCGGPTAMILRSGDLERLSTLKHIVGKAVTKAPSRQLSQYLLGKEGNPLVRFEGRHSGQLLRSIRTALKHAHDGGENKVYFIAVGRVFDDLWETAEKDQETVWWTHIEIDRRLRKDFVGDSPAFEEARVRAMFAAGHDDPVLILGPSGTGKDRLAHIIHNIYVEKMKKNGDLIAVNVAAIPADLLESELFGHTKGAFTGAHASKRGLWQAAQNGTLFLDEIGDMAMPCQAKILRAIESRHIRRVGSTKTISVNARVIAATKQELYPMVNAGLFRDDLFYRLDNGIIRVPGIDRDPRLCRQLAAHFWQHDIANKSKIELPQAVLETLTEYRWPGNGRQLKSRLKYLHQIALGFLKGERLTVDHLRFVMAEDTWAEPER